MSEELLVALVGTGGAVLGAAIGGVCTYRAALIGFSTRKLKSDLRAALGDILLLRELEDRYVGLIAERTGETVQSVRNRVRREVRDSGKGSLSRRAEPRRVEEKIRTLDLE